MPKAEVMARDPPPAAEKAPPSERLKQAKEMLEQGLISQGEFDEIKTKAEQSELMVHEICRDIKSLDYAKRHLTLTITALKRLQMLVTAVEQLSVMTRERMYSEAAHLLQAVSQLLSHFSDYVGIKKVDALREEVAAIRMVADGSTDGDAPQA